MVVAVVVALLSIALGTLLGLVPGSSPRAAGPLRTAAMVTSIAVVLGQLLPESLAHIGMWGLCVFVLGYAAPRVAERAATWLRKPACSHEDAMCTDLGLELGYAGLLLHSAGDGIGLALYSGPLHAGHGHYDVLFAIAGHTVPVAALVALAFKTHRGAGNAVLRAVGVAVATLIGMALPGALPVESLVRAEPWMTALVSGLLLHIVTHGWPVERAPTTLRSRVGDFAALGLGIALVAFGGHGHGHARMHNDGHAQAAGQLADVPEAVHEHAHEGGHEHAQASGSGAGDGALGLREAMGHALLELGLETAPMLLLGLAIAALLQTQGSRIPARVLSGGSRLSQTLRGALVGAPLPVCACGILPVAHGLRRQGAVAAFVVTFLLATPELGVDTLALSVRFLGWPLSLARLFGGLAVAMIAGYMLARAYEREHVHAHPHERSGQPDSRLFASEASDERPLLARAVGHFDELLYHVGAWTLVGLVTAAYLQATLAEGSLSLLNVAGADIGIVTLLAVPSYVCAASATPLAAVLLAKGVSQGAVLTGLLLGPATNVATVAWLKVAYGTRATALGLGALVLTTWALSGLANAFLPMPTLAIGEAVEHTHGPLAYACVVVLVLLLGRAVWRNGLRAWLGSLGATMGHDHAHAHGDHHGHAHGQASDHASGHAH